jgi:dTDP-4-dehydrorhamnose reductase
MARVLVFGSSGQLGRELQRATWQSGIEIVSLDRGGADLARLSTLASAVNGHAPDAVVIAAAYTAVDKAETEEALAQLVNGEAPGVIAAAAEARGAPVIHVSTDYVFDGTKDGFYSEDDAPAPINAYGRSKLAGEFNVRQANPRHLILRTSWVYSAQGSNFLRTMLRLASSQEEVRVVNDQLGCPTAASDLAGAIARLVPVTLNGGAGWGTYHLAGGSATSWHGFAEALFGYLASLGIRRPRNIPIPSSAYPTPARRPQNSRLSSSRFQQAFGFGLPGYEQTAPAVLQQALAQA